MSLLGYFGNRLNYSTNYKQLSEDIVYSNFKLEYTDEAKEEFRSIMSMFDIAIE